MLLKKYKNIDISLLNFDLTQQHSGINLKIDKKSDYKIDDDTLRKIQKINNIDFLYLNDQYFNILKTLNCQNKNITWRHFIGENNYITYKSKFKNMLIDLNNVGLTDYYFKILKKRYDLTNMINPIVFVDDISKNTVYQHDSTITGRMIISSGLNFLTLSKEKKAMLKPVCSKNALVEIDIKSCEPVLLHNVLYNESIDDIYQYFAKQFKSEQPRRNIKLAVISTLYGASLQKVKKISGVDSSDVKIIRQHFKVDKIKEYLNNQFEENGKIYNLYGRPIYENGCLINYWLQSSAADYACLGFYRLIKKLNLNLKSVIHDAIIVEANQQDIEKINNIKYINDNITNISLEVDNRVIGI